ncbi:MAG: HEAT repeat domain-containing protein [bacterium]
MGALAVLLVIGIMQGVFLLLLVLFLGVRHQVDRHRDRTFIATSEHVAERMNAWLAGSGRAEEFVASLRALRGATAVGVAGNLLQTSIPGAERVALANALRDEPWVRRALAGGSSRRWGRRLECARCLALVGTPADGVLLESLLTDERPSIGIAAVSALPLVADARLVGVVLDRIVTMPVVVRHYLHATLRELRTLVEPALTERLARRDASIIELSGWTELAGALQLPSSIDQAALLESHSNADVRKGVARALRRVPRQRSVDALQRLLCDPDDSVRAVAAHGLGELASASAIPALLVAARDPVWNVRYRATLALSQLGEPGRAAVRVLRNDGDHYVSDIATLVTGLSDGALLDLVEA